MMFSKLLKDEHIAATTPPNTRFSRGTSSSGDKRGNAPLLSNLGRLRKGLGLALLWPLLPVLLIMPLLFLLLLLLLLLPGILEEDPLSFFASQGSI
ncbi:UNVERIFIED_CONTAM: hypothetical protein Sangu_2153300 [Sesamum angustifolium]|uniref:Uncharacterized protein n=1 Tax=Sesamum angustifolium TaxID=2727405 RepID=A0AAW2LE35_9LAMI